MTTVQISKSSKGMNETMQRGNNKIQQQNQRDQLNDKIQATQQDQIQDHSADNKQKRESIQNQIKTYLKSMVQQKNIIKKLMISCILSNLYIQQFNYQQAYKILNDVEKTIQKIEQLHQKEKQQQKPRINSHQEFDLAILKIKMYTNFILIEIINLQTQSFQEHLNQVFNFILGWRTRVNKENVSNNQQSENINPNIKSRKQIQGKQGQKTMILLFKLFLKGLSGFESFQNIQAQTLIAQCNLQKTSNNDIQGYFYFSNISFIKLLSTSDYESAYKFQAHSLQIIQRQIRKLRKTSEQISLREVILKTVCLKKLIYLSQELQLPKQIIKKYKQQLSSTDCMKSQYLNGLQQNTIFRNYNQKIDMGFRVIMKLKQFQNEVIVPILFNEQTNYHQKSRSNVSGQKEQKIFELWQYKALKHKFIQLLSSKSLEREIKTKQNIISMIFCIDKGIQIQRCCIYNKDSSSVSRVRQKLSVEQQVILQNIKQTKPKLTTSNKINSKNRSIYENAVIDYSSRLQILTSSLQNIMIVPYLREVVQNISNYYSSSQRYFSYKFSDNTDLQKGEDNQKYYVIKDKQSHKKNKMKINVSPQRKQTSYHQPQQSDSQSQPSIHLDDVEVQVINTKKNKFQYAKIAPINTKQQKQKIPNNHLSQQISYQHNNKHKPFYQSNQPKVDQSKQKYKNIINDGKKLAYTNNPSSKTTYLNDRNQVYVNYAELGSRVKLNQTTKHVAMNKVQQQQNHPQKVNQNKPKYEDKKYHIFDRNTQQQQVNNKKYNFNQSLTKQQGQVSQPNQESVVKFIDKKYPFEEKYKQNHAPLSLLTEDKKNNSQYKNVQILESFSYKGKNKLYLETNHYEKEKEYDQKSFDGRSLTKSRKKHSSISPKVAKDSTIGTRLNEHLKRHELTYSPSSAASRIKPNKLFKQTQLIDKSDDQSVRISQKQKTKNKSKVQKAGGFSKNPTQLQSQFKNQTIKFKDYIDGLQKSGIKVKQQDQLKRNPSRSKIQNQGHTFKSQIRRNVSEANQVIQQKYMSQLGENNAQNRSNKNILEYFFSEIPNDRYARIQKGSQSSKGSSPQTHKVNQVSKPLKADKQSKVSQKSVASNNGSIKQLGQSRSPKAPISKVVSISKPLSNDQKSQNQPFIKQTSSSLAQFPIQSMFSPNVLGDYIMKLVKNHKQKLKDMIRLCQNGQYVDKKHKSSDGGQQRFMRLSHDHAYLEWAVSQQKLLSGNKTKYEIRNIKGIVFGKVTPTFRKKQNMLLQPHKCFSFIFQKRSYDIYLSTETDSNFWLPGMSHFISQNRPQLTHPNYTTNIQRFIKRRARRNEKDQTRQNTGYYSLGRVLWKRALLKMQHLYLSKNKKISYKNRNAGAIIQFGKSIANEQKSIKNKSMLPPKGKQSKVSIKDKSLQSVKQ